MKMKPLFDRVILKLIENKNKTSSGIYIPESTSEKPYVGKVVAVGEGGKIDGNEIDIKVKVGDKVLFSKFAGIEYKVENDEFLIIRQGDILAVVEEWYEQKNFNRRTGKASARKRS